MWDLSCPDWEDRIRLGESLVPDLPLIESEAQMGLRFFDELQLPDVPEMPRLGDAAGQWFRDIVRAMFGSWDPVAQQRYIREIFTMVPKGSSKTTYSAGVMIAAMLMNRRPRAEMLLVGPTQAISDRAYEQAEGMISLSPDLRRRFQATAHNKTVLDLLNNSEMKVRTFDLNIITGSIVVFVLLDEIHLLGRNRHTSRVLNQIRGGLDKTSEGFLLMTTTQSDEIPAGAFREELLMARKIRNGEYRGQDIRPMLPVLYEFPRDIATDPAKWGDPANWPMVLPNLGKPMKISDLIASRLTAKEKGHQAEREWASQFLNIEMGVGMPTDGWPGAEFWVAAEDETIKSIDDLIARCEVIVIGVDGGGLDDLFGFAALGREKETKRWLSWSHAWCHKGVLERRQTIAAELQSFADDGELTIVDDRLEDVTEIVALVDKVNEAGLLACVAIDSEGPYGEFVDALDEIGITEEGEQIVGIGQGYKLMNAIKTTERKLANGTLVHAPSRMMNWCVQNVRIEPTATAIRATKQNAGDAKIDPWCALMDAATVMVRNPDASGPSVYDQLADGQPAQSGVEQAQGHDIDMSILSNPKHPRWQEMRARWERRHLSDEFEDAF